MTVSELYKYLQDLVETNTINYNTEVQVASWDECSWYTNCNRL